MELLQLFGARQVGRSPDRLRVKQIMGQATLFKSAPH
jgi:hypothetical protein